MKKTARSGLLILILALFTLGGCGTSHNDTQPTTPTTAIVKIMSQGDLSSGTQIGGIEVAVLLPSGVTVKATPDSMNPAVQVTNPGVVVASGVAAGSNTNTIGTYFAATATVPGKVLVQVANANGFGTGEFVTVNCDIAAGNNPQVTDFSATIVKAVDLNGVAITVLTPGLTADIQ